MIRNIILYAKFNGNITQAFRIRQLSHRRPRRRRVGRHVRYDVHGPGESDERLGLGFATSEPGDGTVRYDPAHPRAGVVVRADRLPLFVRLQEGVLCEIFGTRSAP